MRVPPETAEIEALARQIREAGAVLLDADMFDRWGPRDDVEQRQAIERAAAGAEQARRDGIAALDRRVPELREQNPEVIAAWADAHVELLDDYLGRVAADTTEAYVAREERAAWLELRAGERTRVQQNTFYVHYDPELYRAIFGDPSQPAG